MRVQFLGSGDAFGSGGRFNTCILARAGAHSFLIDCGASALIAMRKFGVDPNAIGAVFVSHLHGDHFGGLPFLLLDAQFYSRRTAPLHLFGPPGLAARLDAAMEVFFSGSSETARRFPLEIVELAESAQTQWCGVTVTPFQVRHPCGAPPFALRIAHDGKHLTYTGDTEWTDALIDAGRGADLLIAECLSFSKTIPHHLSYATLRANLERIGAKRVILTHMGPEMLAHAGEIPEAKAEDGLVVDV